MSLFDCIACYPNLCHCGGAGLSRKVTDLCAAHYGKLGSGCGKCPIHRECISGCRPGGEGLREWRERCNAAAEAAA